MAPERKLEDGNLLYSSFNARISYRSFVLEYIVCRGISADGAAARQASVDSRPSFTFPGFAFSASSL